MPLPADDQTTRAAAQPLSQADARLIARQILRELSDNFAEYVGRGVISMAWKGFALLLLALAAFGWAHFSGLWSSSQHTGTH